jgi:hypothetical protein
MQKYGARYAMTNIEAAEYLGEYMEQTRQLGNLERLEAYTSADALDKSIVGVRKFSSALGMSVSDFQKTMSDLSKNSDIRRVMANVSENSRPALLSVFAMWEKTGQTGIAETVKKMLESPAVMARETAKIGAWLGADAADSIHEFVGAAMDGTLSVENQVEMANRLTESLSRTGNYEEVMHMLSLFAASGDSTAIMLKDMMISAKLAKEQLDKNTAVEAANNAKFSTKVSNLAERLSGALDKILGGLLTPEFVGELGSIIDSLGSGVEGFSDVMKPFAEWVGSILNILPVKGDEWLYTIDMFMAKLKDWVDGKIGLTGLLLGGKSEGQKKVETEKRIQLVSNLKNTYGYSGDLSELNVEGLQTATRIAYRAKKLNTITDPVARAKMSAEMEKDKNLLPKQDTEKNTPIDDVIDWGTEKIENSVKEKILDYFIKLVTLQAEGNKTLENIEKNGRDNSAG